VIAHSRECANNNVVVAVVILSEVHAPLDVFMRWRDQRGSDLEQNLVNVSPG